MNRKSAYRGARRVVKGFVVLAGLFGVFALGFFTNPQRADAAVPTWTVGFDQNTNYELSLEVFLYNLFRDLQEREEEFQLSYDLTKIEKAREDVNKLIYEAFVELRSEPLLIEFRRITKQCGTFTDYAGSEDGGDFLDPNGDDPNAIPREEITACQFASEIVETLKGRGVEILIQDEFNEDRAATSVNSQANGLCINGARTAEGECIIIKQDGRIITNPDNFIFEEPIQKARDFVYCYLGQWRHFPFDGQDTTPGQCQALGLDEASCTTANACQAMAKQGIKCQSDVVRDQIKKTFLFDMNRKLKALETAPPESFYTPARCELILNNLQCPKITGFGETQGQTNEVLLNQSEACIFRQEDLDPKLKKPLGQFFSFTDLKNAARDQESTVYGVMARVQETILDIIGDYEELRTAQYIAGQGLKSEKYLIGYQSYTDNEYNDLLARIAEGGTEDETGKDNAPIPSGDYYYVDTEDVISPAAILLGKLNAATQAQFDLAAQAFKAPRTLTTDDEGNDKLTQTSDRLTIGETRPKNGFEFSPADSFNTVDGETIPAQGPLEFVRLNGVKELPAPFEDTKVQLPPGYLSGELPESIYENPQLRGNYFNQWYKDVLQLHQQNFSTVVKQWFREPHKGYFTPDR